MTKAEARELHREVAELRGQVAALTALVQAFGARPQRYRQPAPIPIVSPIPFGSPNICQSEGSTPIPGERLVSSQGPRR